MTPLSASFGTWSILKQANGMGLVANTRILERSQVTCTFHEMKNKWAREFMEEVKRLTEEVCLYFLMRDGLLTTNLLVGGSRL